MQRASGVRSIHRTITLLSPSLAISLSRRTPFPPPSLFPSLSLSLFLAPPLPPSPSILLSFVYRVLMMVT